MFGLGKKIYQEIEIPRSIEARERLLERLVGKNIRVVLEYSDNFSDKCVLRDKGKLILSTLDEGKKEYGLAAKSFGIIGKLFGLVSYLAEYSVGNIKKLEVERTDELSWLR